MAVQPLVRNPFTVLRTAQLAATVMLSALVSVACSQAAPLATQPLPTPASADSRAQASATSGQASSVPAQGSALDACSLLSDAEIQQVTQRTVASKKPGTVQGIFDNGCSWELTPSEKDMVGWTIKLGVVSPGGRHYFDTYFRPYDSPIPGLGDAAVKREVGSIEAAKGDTLVSVFIDALGDTNQVTRDLVTVALKHVP